jgi:transmembrane sensor
MESSRRQHTEDRATEFLQKRESETWSDADQAALTAWMQASTSHRVAFLRAEAAWEQMGRLKALGAGLPRFKVPTPAELDSAHLRGERGEAQARARPRRVFGAFIGVAASLAAIIGVALGVYQAWFSGERYATPVGGVASLPLEDGSRITLNTDSKVRVIFSNRERHIDLSQGEAFFEVASDGDRPFVVQAGARRVVAVGTKFSVRRDHEGIQVVVTEGKVRVEDERLASGSAARATGTIPGASEAASQGIVLAAGGLARAGDSDVVVQNRAPAEAEEMLSWRSGYVVFHETPLAQAVAEFNRYNARQIVIRDAGVATIPLTGKFRATHNETFVNLLEQAYQVPVERTPEAFVLGAAAASRE